MKLNQAAVTKSGRRISLALALSLIMFLPVAHGANTITLTSPNSILFGNFGKSVAVSEGDPLVVVGAPGETAGGEGGAGNAYVLDTATGLITKLTSPNPNVNGAFGNSVAVSGTTVVVGAPFETADGKSLAGNAYVFDATTGFLTSTTLVNPTSQISGQFGFSVAVSGTTVVVGATDESPGGKSGAGNAYVFDATDGSFTTTLTSPNQEIGGGFGWSVAVSGTTVVVGALFETAGGQSRAGNAHVFDATTGFLTSKTLMSPTPEADGDFGWSVSVSGTTVVVGAPREKVDGQANAGHAYIFGSATGSLSTTTLTSPYAQASGEFGRSVSVGGTTVVVGAPLETAGGQSFAGHAYSFDAKTGFLTTTLASPNPQSGFPVFATNTGNFGLSVAVSESDPTVVVGAPFESGGGYSYAGHAFIFF